MARSLYQVPYFELTCAPKHELPLGSLTGVTYLRYTVLTSSNNSETAVHCCDPSVSVLAMLVSRNVFHVISALQSTVFYTFFFAEQISCRFYVGSVYRTRSLAFSQSLSVPGDFKFPFWLNSNFFTCTSYGSTLLPTHPRAFDMHV